MIKDKLFIFPTHKQIEYICSKDLPYNIYIVSRERVEKKDVTVISENTVKDLNEDIDVLCCHEESLYWAYAFGKMGWKYQFLPHVLNILTKDKFKDYISRYNILNTRYSKEFSNINNYPIVAKPIIGFGSIGVKMIDSKSMYAQLLERKNEILTRVEPYRDKYFRNIDNYYIYEEYIAGEFYRTPFVVYDKVIKYIFPIRGKSKTERNNSDFHWTDFEYGDKERIIAPELKKKLYDLLDAFGLVSGVYVAEFIISEENKIYLLEFSPRQTSERIIKLIKLASGVDLEQMAIDIFLKDVFFSQPKENSVRMIIQHTDIVVPIDNYKIIECQKEQSVYGDKISTVYCERI